MKGVKMKKPVKKPA